MASKGNKSKSIMKALKEAAIGGTFVWAGALTFDMLYYQLYQYLPASLTSTVGVGKAIAGVAGIALVDLVTPKKYAKEAAYAGAGMAAEVITSFVAPYVYSNLSNNNLLSSADAARGLLGASLPTTSATTNAATSGYARLRGYSRIGAAPNRARPMQGYASLRGGMFPNQNLLGV